MLIIIMSKETYCRICKSNDLHLVISMGNQKITSIFPLYGKDNEIPSTPVNLCMCNICGLIQLEEPCDSDSMYKNGNYGYRSGISNTMITHLQNYNDEINSKIKLDTNDYVLDIGSNDATFLKFYNNVNKIGIDPTGEQFKNYYTDIDLIPNYFTKENFTEKYGELKCKVITSICCFYDLPDPVKFAKDVHYILDDEGIWSSEQSYLLTMLKTNSIDTICHEHIEYYSLTQIKDIADRANLKIIDVTFNSSNGGSFRIYFSKKSSKNHIECTELIEKILKEEDTYGVKNPDTYKKFVNNCNSELKKLTDFIDIVNSNNKSIQIYGASTKGNCVLQYCNIGPNQIKYAVERNEQKIGLCTNTGIEIISEETMRKNPPDYLLVLPWHFKNEIIQREKEYLDNGGQLIFYFPTFEIISNKPKTLITGCDGFIASYVKDHFNSHCLYGISRKNDKLEKNITKSFFDMNDYNKLEDFIKIINPDNIIHLASISSSIEAFENPFETLQNNGMLTAKLCDIIYRNNKNIKLFNASSSEIYKDHQKFLVDEYKNIDNTKHLHPYSIAKIMGQNIVRFYRETYNLHFSNGILFTTQSIDKSNNFLLNKIHHHLKNNKDEPLKIGNIDSYRNIIHPIDVVNGIEFILKAEEGDDYSICNYDSVKIKDLVIQLYNNFEFDLISKDEKEEIYYDKITDKALLIIENNNNGLDTKKIDIKGYPQKLIKLGWSIQYAIKNIINDFK